MRYGKISHIWASKQAGRQVGGVWVGKVERRISGEQGMGCVCERWCWGRRVIGAKEGGIERRGGRQRVQARNMFWNINLWFWPWAGAQRRKKEQGNLWSEGMFPAFVKRPCWWRTTGAGAMCFSLTSESPCLHSTPCNLLVQRVFRVFPFPSPDTNEMSVVQSPNPLCLVKPLKGILTVA